MFTKKYIFAKNRKMTEIQEKHNEIFTFLMKKREQNPELRFLLRSINKGEKLKKGYWFYGDERYLGISFWNAWATLWERQEISIQFSIFEDGYCRIELRGNENSEKAEILKKIADALSFQKTSTAYDGIQNYWVKTFNDKDYIKNLEQFIIEDKPFIDNFIKRFDKDNSLFPFITEELFNSTLTKIRNWQKSKPKTLDTTIQNAAKLLELRIENIKRFSNTYININKPVVCFYGKNGTGKTTLLRSIALAIVDSSNLNSSDDSIKYIPKMLDGSKEAFVEKARIDLAYTIEDFTETEPSYNALILTPKSINDSLEIENQYKLEYSEEENPRTFNLVGEEKNIFKTLMIGFAQQNGRKDYKNGKKIWKANVDDLNALIYDKADNRFPEFIYWIGKKLDITEIGDAEQLIKNRLQINQIFQVISKITGDDISLHEKISRVVVVTKSHPNGLPLHLMSQGYQNVVGWVGFFMKRLWEFGQTELPDEDFRQMPAICLIDEIDTYLHPEWQYRILSVLVENFVNVQFIVTSHSPYVLSSIPNDKILLYELIDENGEIVIRRETENLFGADINEVSREMGTTKRFEAIDKKVDALFSEIYDNQLDTTDNVEKNAEKTLAELQQQINVNDSDLIKATTLIKTKKLLRQRKQA